jgi:hypothetical protein
MEITAVNYFNSISNPSSLASINGVLAGGLYFESNNFIPKNNFKVTAKIYLKG